MDYANTTNVEFIVDPKVLFHGWLTKLQLFAPKLIKWLPGECADWFFDNIIHFNEKKKKKKQLQKYRRYRSHTSTLIKNKQELCQNHSPWLNSSL